MIVRRVRLLAAVAAMGSAGCAGEAPPQPEVRVEGAWVRAVAGPDANTAAYLTLRNAGSAPDRLLGARCEAARATELHRTTIDDAGLAKMGRVEAVDLPVGRSVALEPGGYHLMLMGAGPLAEGDTVRLTLLFEASGAVEVAAEVRPS